MERLIVTLALSLLAGFSVALAKGADQAHPHEARKRLDYANGSWSSSTESIGRDVRVRRTSYSDTERRIDLEDRY